MTTLIWYRRIYNLQDIIEAVSNAFALTLVFSSPYFLFLCAGVPAIQRRSWRIAFKKLVVVLTIFVASTIVFFMLIASILGWDFGSGGLMLSGIYILIAVAAAFGYRWPGTAEQRTSGTAGTFSTTSRFRQPIRVFMYCFSLWLLAILVSVITAFYSQRFLYRRPSLLGWQEFENVWMDMVVPRALIDTFPGFLLIWAGMVFIQKRKWSRTTQRLVGAGWAIAQACLIFLLIWMILRTLRWSSWPLMASYTAVLVVGMLVWKWKGRGRVESAAGTPLSER
jgi:hypothetical protein